jgi:hypothetical protein
MIRRINSRTGRIFSLLFLLSVGFQACHGPALPDHSRSDAEKKVTLSVTAFKSDSSDTWGYEILIDNKVFIHQEYIPALEGNLPFANKRDALKVGRAVMLKIKNQESPTLSKEEVMTLLDLKK